MNITGKRKRLFIWLLLILLIVCCCPAGVTAKAKTTSAAAGEGTVLARVNIRKKPDISSSIEGKLSEGDTVELQKLVSGTDGNGWYLIKSAAGEKGYVLASAIKEEKTNDAGAAVSKAAEKEPAAVAASTEATSSMDAQSGVSASSSVAASVESISQSVLATDPSEAEEPATEIPDVADAEYSKVFKFSNDMVFSGIYKTTSFYFETEKYWNTKYAYATIEYTVSPLIKNDVPASMTFFVNNTPVYSCKVKYEDGKSQVTYVVIPVALLDEGYNNLSNTGYVRLYDEDGCLDDFSGANWIDIAAESQIQIGYDLIDTQHSLNYYPYPMISSMDEFGKKCGIYVPADASDEELKAAMLIRADLGNETSDEDDVALETFDTEMRGNRVIIATKDRLPDDVSAKMPENTYDLSRGALVYEYGEADSNVLVLTARDDKNLYEACALLMDDSRISQEKSNMAYVAAGSADKVIENSSLSDLIVDSETIESITGNPGIEFVGPFRQEQILYLPITGGFVLAEGGKISLNFRYSENLDFTRSMITVYWGDTPVASKKLEKADATGDSLSFVMPSDVVGTYAGSIKIAFDLEIQDMFCTKRADEMPWAYVTGDSTLFLPVGQSSKYSLDLRPYPFQLMGYYNDLALILPDNMTQTQLELAGRIMALEGNSIGPYGKLSVYRASEFDSSGTDMNQIVIGTYADNTYIQKLNDQLSFRYSADGSRFESNDKLLLSDSYASKIGVLQIIRSPEFSGRAIMVVSGAQEDMLDNILSYTRIADNCRKLQGDAYLIDSTMDTRYFTFLKEENEVNASLLDQILENKDAIAFTLISTLAMAILVLAVILILLRIRKNSKSDEEK